MGNTHASDQEEVQSACDSSERTSTIQSSIHRPISVPVLRKKSVFYKNPETRNFVIKKQPGITRFSQISPNNNSSKKYNIFNNSGNKNIHAQSIQLSDTKYTYRPYSHEITNRKPNIHQISQFQTSVNNANNSNQRTNANMISNQNHSQSVNSQGVYTQRPIYLQSRSVDTTRPKKNITTHVIKPSVNPFINAELPARKDNRTFTISPVKSAVVIKSQRKVLQEVDQKKHIFYLQQHQQQQQPPKRYVYQEVHVLPVSLHNQSYYLQQQNINQQKQYLLQNQTTYSTQPIHYSPSKCPYTQQSASQSISYKSPIRKANFIQSDYSQPQNQKQKDYKQSSSPLILTPSRIQLMSQSNQSSQRGSTSINQLNKFQYSSHQLSHLQQQQEKQKEQDQKNYEKQIPYSSPEKYQYRNQYIQETSKYGYLQNYNKENAAVNMEYQKNCGVQTDGSERKLNQNTQIYSISLKSKSKENYPSNSYLSSYNKESERQYQSYDFPPMQQIVPEYQDTQQQQQQFYKKPYQKDYYNYKKQQGDEEIQPSNDQAKSNKQDQELMTNFTTVYINQKKKEMKEEYIPSNQHEQQYQSYNDGQKIQQNKYYNDSKTEKQQLNTYEDVHEINTSYPIKNSQIDSYSDKYQSQRIYDYPHSEVMYPQKQENIQQEKTQQKEVYIGSHLKCDEEEKPYKQYTFDSQNQDDVSVNKPLNKSLVFATDTDKNIIMNSLDYSYSYSKSRQNPENQISGQQQHLDQSQLNNYILEQNKEWEAKQLEEINKKYKINHQKLDKIIGEISKQKQNKEQSNLSNRQQQSIDNIDLQTCNNTDSKNISHDQSSSNNNLIQIQNEEGNQQNEKQVILEELSQEKVKHQQKQQERKNTLELEPECSKEEILQQETQEEKQKEEEQEAVQETRNIEYSERELVSNSFTQSQLNSSQGYKGQNEKENQFQDISHRTNFIEQEPNQQEKSCEDQPQGDLELTQSKKDLLNSVKISINQCTNEQIEFLSRREPLQPSYRKQYQVSPSQSPQQNKNQTSIGVPDSVRSGGPLQPKLLNFYISMQRIASENEEKSEDNEQILQQEKQQNSKNNPMEEKANPNKNDKVENQENIAISSQQKSIQQSIHFESFNDNFNQYNSKLKQSQDSIKRVNSQSMEQSENNKNPKKQSLLPPHHQQIQNFQNQMPEVQKQAQENNSFNGFSLQSTERHYLETPKLANQESVSELQQFNIQISSNCKIIEGNDFENVHQMEAGNDIKDNQLNCENINHQLKTVNQDLNNDNKIKLTLNDLNDLKINVIMEPSSESMQHNHSSIQNSDQKILESSKRFSERHENINTENQKPQDLKNTQQQHNKQQEIDSIKIKLSEKKELVTESSSIKDQKNNSKRKELLEPEDEIMPAQLNFNTPNSAYSKQIIFNAQDGQRNNQNNQVFLKQQSFGLEKSNDSQKSSNIQSHTEMQKQSNLNLPIQQDKNSQIISQHSSPQHTPLFPKTTEEKLGKQFSLKSYYIGYENPDISEIKPPDQASSFSPNQSLLHEINPGIHDSINERAFSNFQGEGFDHLSQFGQVKTYRSSTNEQINKLRSQSVSDNNNVSLHISKTNKDKTKHPKQYITSPLQQNNNIESNEVDQKQQEIGEKNKIQQNSFCQSGIFKNLLKQQQKGKQNQQKSINDNSQTQKMQYQYIQQSRQQSPNNSHQVSQMNSSTQQYLQEYQTQRQNQQLQNNNIINQQINQQQINSNNNQKNLQKKQKGGKQLQQQPNTLYADVLRQYVKKNKL